MIKLQIVDSGRTGEQRVTREGGELAGAEDEEERAEAGEQQQDQVQNPPIMRNGDNLCYAVSAFHLLECVKVIIICAFVIQVIISVLQAHDNLHPSVPRSVAGEALEQCLVDMARRYLKLHHDHCSHIQSPFFTFAYCPHLNLFYLVALCLKPLRHPFMWLVVQWAVDNPCNNAVCI